VLQRSSLSTYHFFSEPHLDSLEDEHRRISNELKLKEYRTKPLSAGLVMTRTRESADLSARCLEIKEVASLKEEV